MKLDISNIVSDIIQITMQSSKLTKAGFYGHKTSLLAEICLCRFTTGSLNYCKMNLLNAVFKNCISCYISLMLPREIVRRMSPLRRGMHCTYIENILITSNQTNIRNRND